MLFWNYLGIPVSPHLKKKERRAKKVKAVNTVSSPAVGTMDSQRGLAQGLMEGEN